MDNRLKKQLMVIFILLTAFALFNYGIYSLFTVRYIDKSSNLMREQSIEIDKYLPFDDSSKIVKLSSDLKITGELPVLDGATALFPVYSAFMNAIYPNGSCDFDGNDFTTSSYLQKRGTTGAYQAIVKGTADIIFVAQPSEKQIQYAKESGVELVYVPIGYEAFVFITNAANPVESLKIEQLQGIYSGRYTNWNQVGGANSPINALQRAEDSGSQTAMQKFMANQPLLTRTSNLFGKSIGYSFRCYVADISSKENVKMLAVNNIYPTEDNIRNGSYPIIDSFYAVYRLDSQNKNIKIIIDWILSDEGQLIIDSSGYVNLAKN